MHPELGQIVTQIIGFIVALWILKRYAWKPMLQMLEDRRSGIRKELDDTAADRKQAAETLAGYEAKLRNVAAEGRARIQEAVREGQGVAAEIKESARKEAHTFLERAQEEIEREKDKARIELRRDVVDLSIRATEKLLRETVDEERNRRMVDAFIDELGGLE
ncbi:MAG: F0F1 ATP synthase subunit B [Candidatus Eisenbacteria sp.]|nr:F0F1 ATP synthase subunit B [Candidatus Eisenbacteria bacterium]